MDIETVITTLRNALAPDASADVRAAGATACRAVLATLEPTAQSPVSDALNPAAVATAVAALRSVPPDQLLDLAITKLRAALPAGVQVAPVAPLKFHLIPIPHRG